MFFVSPLEWLTSNHEVHKAFGCPSQIFEGVRASIRRLWGTNSVGDVFQRLKKSGSVTLETPLKGKILMEITQDGGKLVFLAIDESYKPLMIREVDTKLFETKVISYLNKVIKGSLTITYRSRWKNGEFESLKSTYITQTRLRALLKLPGEEPLQFGTSLEAECVLKYYYLDRKTPLEESKDWSSIILMISSLFFDRNQ